MKRLILLFTFCLSVTTILMGQGEKISRGSMRVTGHFRADKFITSLDSVKAPKIIASDQLTVRDTTINNLILKHGGNGVDNSLIEPELTKIIYIDITNGSDVTGTGVDAAHAFQSFYGAVLSLKPYLNGSIGFRFMPGSYTITNAALLELSKKRYVGTGNGAINLRGETVTDFLTGFVLTRTTNDPSVYNVTIGGTPVTWPWNGYKNYFLASGTTYIPILGNGVSTIDCPYLPSLSYNVYNKLVQLTATIQFEDVSGNVNYVMRNVLNKMNCSQLTFLNIIIKNQPDKTLYFSGNPKTDISPTSCLFDITLTTMKNGIYIYEAGRVTFSKTAISVNGLVTAGSGTGIYVSSTQKTEFLQSQIRYDGNVAINYNFGLKFNRGSLGQVRFAGLGISGWPCAISAEVTNIGGSGDNDNMIKFKRCGIVYCPEDNNTKFTFSRVKEEGTGSYEGGVLILDSVNYFLHRNIATLATEIIVPRMIGTWMTSFNYKYPQTWTTSYQNQGTPITLGFATTASTYYPEFNYNEFYSPRYGINIKVPGVYGEEDWNQKATLTNNATTAVVVGDITMNTDITIDYFIERGSGRRSGSFKILYDGSALYKSTDDFTTNSVEGVSGTGIAFTTAINAVNSNLIDIRATLDNSGGNATFKYYAKRTMKTN